MQESNPANDKFTATQVAAILQISVPTLTNWYTWYNDPSYEKPEGLPELPLYTRAGNTNRSPRLWTEQDVEKIKVFQSFIKRGKGGFMGDFNAKFWGERGKRALKNRDV